MPTRSLSLSDQQDLFIHRLVESGRYRNAGEVIRAALRAMEQREAEVSGALDWLRHQIEPGLQEARQGRFEQGTIDEIFDRIDRELDAEDAAPQ